QLVGVELDPEPVRARGEQDPPRLLDREDTLVAEHVREARQSLAREGGNHGPGEERNVLLAARAIFVRDLVGAEERGHDLDRGGLRGAPERPKLLSLLLELQPVAALRLDRRG